MNKFLKLAITLIACIISTPVLSQVTIGMGEAPARTALLQIKDQSADANNITSKTGGFLLPRVGLVNLKTLQSFMETTDPGYNDEKRNSVGLFVFNITRSEPDSIYPGLYFWDGDQWDMIALRSGGGGSSTDTIPTIEPPIIDIDNPSALKLSNCYIVNPGRTVDFPVSKAYAVWKQRLNTDLAEKGTDLSVDLLWQDRKDLISEVKLAHGNQGLQSEIRITTNSSGYAGNAVVVLKVGGVICWSWHIWVVNYDPAATQIDFNGYTFMDRNLGALYVDKGVVDSKGLIYQWGRKDPFPNSATTTGNEEREIYDINNNIVTISKVDARTLPLVDNRHIEDAIFNPLMYLYTLSAGEDWYADDKANKNDYLWDNENGEKGASDPCPPGWRVPSTTNPSSSSPWATMAAQPMVAGTGITDPQAGYYPAAGYRSATTGELTNVGAQGDVWCGTALVDEETVFNLYFMDYTLLSNQRSSRAMGASVRCVKE